MNVLPSRTYAPDAPMRKRLFTKEATAHPAKMSLPLCRDLFLRYTQAGQTVLDPFGGIGSSLLGAALPEPRNVILHELEPAFVALARGNWDKIKRRTLPGMPLGGVTILQGDSRHLPLPDAECAGAVSSPPYAEALSGAGGRQRALMAGDADYDARRGYGLSDGVGYSTNAQNIGNLPHAAIASPPFGAMQSDSSGGNVGNMRPNKDGAGFEQGPRENWVYSKDTPGQIGNLSHTPSVAISSPPFADSVGNMRPDHVLRQKLEAKHGRTFAGSMNGATEYGQTPGQIGSLSHTPSAAIGSPPYGDVASRNRSEEPSSLESPYAESHGKAAPNRHVDGYGQTSGQIGNDGGDTYASACLAVYRECYRVIRPGGVLVLVTGDYIRAGVRVDLAADTIQLAVAAGWIPVERWVHAKAQVSFWRRLYANKHPGAPTVTTEDVLVFVKEYQGWPFVDLAPTTLPPASLTPAVTPENVTSSQQRLFGS